ncbi:hypothetical protein F2Q70_00009881 [Brassica cretica]|uniref:CTP synthase n=1 Tax=Brassica cretica TaxID=69181 RepID=A0A8S9MDA2_BRACR|nr:hypothetical protein F2Q70_00009881 [Brassica cretica]
MSQQTTLLFTQLSHWGFTDFIFGLTMVYAALIMYDDAQVKKKLKMKYVLVTGGVVSGLGKGVTASSIGLLLQACGLRVTSIKIDPYLNTDAGTMSPFEHGEVFVLDDGGEVDLDLGNYERFLDSTLSRDNNLTTGKIYQSVIDKERKGDYLGKTVQVVPHVTDAIQEWIERVANVHVDGKEGPPDVCVIELGATIVTCYQLHNLLSFLFLGPDNFCLVHVSLVPVLSVVGEQKTKPTQHSVRGLRSLGLTPNILACRSTKALEDNVKTKLSQFCHVPEENIVTLYDVPNIWHVPLLLRVSKFVHKAILKQLNLLGKAVEADMTEWSARTKVYDTLQDPVKIAMVGKYTGLTDSYLSVLKALLHASVACHKKLIVEWVAASDLEEITAQEASDVHKAAWDLLKGADGILVPGGFGDRGVQGKILATKFARENQVPFLGICLGMQLAVVEFARSILGFEDANSTEFEPETSSPCVIFMPEVNPDMISEIENAGLSFVGKDETGRRMEIVELQNHPYFVGVQFHPEFKSRPGKPSALFLGLMAAASGCLEAVLQASVKVNKVSTNSIVANGPAMERVYQNGNVYSNGNGLHH